MVQTSRYDPSVDIPTDVETEQDRVIFIKSAAQFMVGEMQVASLDVSSALPYQYAANIYEVHARTL